MLEVDENTIYKITELEIFKNENELFSELEWKTQ